MRKLLLSLVLVIGFAVPFYAAADFATMTNDLMKVATTVAAAINNGTAPNMGYYTGSGNIFPVNTSGFLGLKLGVGLGVNIPASLIEVAQDPNNLSKYFKPESSNPMAAAFDSMGKAVALVPFPYDMAYLKVGLPILPMDVGIRVGVVPTMGFPVGVGQTANVGALHLGAEGRYSIIEVLAGLIKVDGRLSVDYSSGTIGYTYQSVDAAYADGSTLIGTNTTTFTMSHSWSGVSIGAKGVAGLNIPFIGGIYGGLGLNLNFGSVTTAIGTKLDFAPSIAIPSGSADFNAQRSKDYNPLDIRLMVGAQIFFVNAAVEYGVLNRNLAVTLIPIALVF